MIPSFDLQTYKFKIHAHAHYQWSPRLTENEFIKLLSNITEVKIRGTYSRGGNNTRQYSCFTFFWFYLKPQDGF